MSSMLESETAIKRGGGVGSRCQLVFGPQPSAFTSPRVTEVLNFYQHLRLLEQMKRLLHETNVHCTCVVTVCNSLIDAIDETLVPALSLADGNFPYSHELWKLLSHLPYTVRYRTYARWKTVHTVRHPLINIRRGSTFGMTRYVLKFVSLFSSSQTWLFFSISPP